MVEAAGIEPASESASTGASTCVVCQFKRFAWPGRVQTRFPVSLAGLCLSDYRHQHSDSHRPTVVALIPLAGDHGEDASHI